MRREATRIRGSPSVGFFEKQFRRQVRHREFELNPFEVVALDYIRGEVLDLGCGLGNLSLEAARRGCRVTAIDASPTAVARIRRAASRASLQVEAVHADLETCDIERDYDTIVAIGLLMFFRRERALALLGQIRERVRPGGRAVVNVLVEGTTFMDMFTADHYYLFGREELRERFEDWTVLAWRPESFPAPENTVKEFTTLIADKPRPICTGRHTEERPVTTAW